MDAIGPVTGKLAPISALADIGPASPSAGSGEAAARILAPAASVEFRGGSGTPSSSADERQGYERDADSRAIVFRVTDAVSGDVIVQIPNEIVLKARVYARQDDAAVGVRVEKRA